MIRRANLAAGDGAGPATSPATAAHQAATGIALLLVSDDGDILEAAWGAFPVPGRQTVPRAELNGAVLYARHGGTATYWCDASYVVNGAAAHADHKPTGHYEASKNGDLWHEFFLREPTVRKVKAHSTSTTTARLGVYFAFLASALADAVAAAAAVVVSTTGLR